jgi:uncharacterized repeat protein (TIGR01451 family)
MRALLALLLLFAPAIARANDAVALESMVFVEKTVKQPNGVTKTILEAPKIVVPGDKLVFILKYRNTGTQAANHFVVTNPMPSAVAFQSAPTDGAQVSVNGGRDWGQLNELKVKESDGFWREARPEDVTHVRWPMSKPIAAGATGRLSFRGIVR